MQLLFWVMQIFSYTSPTRNAKAFLKRKNTPLYAPRRRLCHPFYLATNCKVNSLLFVHLTESVIQPLILNVVHLAPEVRNQHEVGAPEILKESGIFSTKAPIRAGQPRATPANTNHREGRTRSNSIPNSEHIEWLGGKQIYGVFAFA